MSSVSLDEGVSSGPNNCWHRTLVLYHWTYPVPHTQLARDTSPAPLALDTCPARSTPWHRMRVRHLHTAGVTVCQEISLEGLQQVLYTLVTAIWGPQLCFEGHSTLGVKPPPQYPQPSGEQAQGVQYPLRGTVSPQPGLIGAQCPGGVLPSPHNLSIGKGPPWGYTAYLQTPC